MVLIRHQPDQLREGMQSAVEQCARIELIPQNSAYYGIGAIPLRRGGNGEWSSKILSLLSCNLHMVS